MEYNKQKDNHSSMFHKFTQPTPTAAATTNLLHLHNPFQVAVASASAAAAAANNQPRECQTSEEVDSSNNNNNRSSSASMSREISIQPINLQGGGSSGNDGDSIEYPRRPRGRPPGSKNKPKPAIVLTRDVEPSMAPYILEVPGGHDIVENVASFCSRRNMGLCVLNGFGVIRNVAFRQPLTMSMPATDLTYEGNFHLLSVSATIIPPNANNSLRSVVSRNGVINGFTITLAGPEGQVVGGTVAGSLFSAGTVYLIAASFNNPVFCKLPLEDDQGNSGSGGGGGGPPDGQHQSPPPTAVSAGGGDDGRSLAATTTTGMNSCGGMPMYSSQFQSWVPPARPPTQHQHQQQHHHHHHQPTPY